jgi:hypothetical protein
MTRTTLRHIMMTAWQDARKGAKRFGGQVRDFFAAALQGAWNMLKVEQLRVKLASLKSAARLHDVTMNDGGEGFSPYTHEIASLERQIDRLAEVEFAEKMAAERADEEALWTLELTQQRRGEWNTWVKSANKGGKLHPAQVATQITAQGWSLEPLKRAIARHGL